MLILSASVSLIPKEGAISEGDEEEEGLLDSIYAVSGSGGDALGF